MPPLKKQDIKELEETVENVIKEVKQEDDFKKFVEMEKDVTPEQEVLAQLISMEKNINNVSSGQNRIHKYLIHEINGPEGLKGKQDKANKTFNKIWKILIAFVMVSFICGYSLAVFQHDNMRPFFTDIAKELFKKATHTGD